MVRSQNKFPTKENRPEFPLSTAVMATARAGRGALANLLTASNTLRLEVKLEAIPSGELGVDAQAGSEQRDQNDATEGQ